MEGVNVMCGCEVCVMKCGGVWMWRVHVDVMCGCEV